MYKNELEVQNRVLEHYNKAISLGYEVVGVFLQGSWNYGLGYEGSDVDTKAIILPSIDDVILNKKPVSFTHVMENNEHLDIKDIRLMFECFRKQNINFLEILFTKYKVMNPKYKKLYQPMFDIREDIARYDVEAALNSVVGMMFEKLKALKHPYPTIKDKIEKFGYDPKQLHHIIRCADFFEKYAGGWEYERCLIPTNKEMLINIKRGVMSLEEAERSANFLTTSTKAYKEEYFEQVNLEKKEWVSDRMNEILSDILKYRFKEEIM